MALINCPECKKQVSDSAKACPNCAFDVANYLLRKKIEQSKKWKEQGLCCECGNAEFVKKKKPYFDSIYRRYKGNIITVECAACGWEDRLNGYYDEDGYIFGEGLLEFGLRKIIR